MSKPTYTRTPGMGRPRPAERTQEIQAFASPLSGPQRTLPVRTTKRDGTGNGSNTAAGTLTDRTSGGRQRAGFSGVVPLAPLTTGGSAGSLTFVDGICTAATAPT